jgi:hypothetical protein
MYLSTRAKHHLICDGNGAPIYVLTSGAKVPDISRAVDLLDGHPPIAGRPGLRRTYISRGGAVRLCAESSSVLMTDGGARRIWEIVAGDAVLCYDTLQSHRRNTCCVTAAIRGLAH